MVFMAIIHRDIKHNDSIRNVTWSDSDMAVALTCVTFFKSTKRNIGYISLYI